MLIPVISTSCNNDSNLKLITIVQDGYFVTFVSNLQCYWRGGYTFNGNINTDLISYKDKTLSVTIRTSDAWSDLYVYFSTSYDYGWKTAWTCDHS